jgi:hypothetical protein
VAFTHTLVTLEALDRAKAVGRLIGGEAQLKQRITAVTDELKAYPVLPDHKVTRIMRGDRRYHTLRRVEVPEHSVRPRASKAKCDALRKSRPRAYEAAVRVVPPAQPYHARLDSTGRLASTEWAAVREEGSAIWQDKLAQRFGTREWNARNQVDILFDLRNLRLDEEKRIAAAKVELMKFIVANDLPRIIPSFGDGRLVLRENGPPYTVDYELLEKEFPAALNLFPASTVKGSVRLDFVVWTPTPDEPDDSDDSAYGIWH